MIAPRPHRSLRREHTPGAGRKGGADIRALADLPLAVSTFTALSAFVYVFGFNFLPQGMRSLLAGILAVSAIGAFALELRKQARSPSSAMMTGALLLMLGVALITLTAYRPPSDIAVVIRNFSGILLIAWSLTQIRWSAGLERLLACLGVAAIALCILLPIIDDPILRAGTLRMGSITSGHESLHPSAYLTVIVAFWALAMGYFKKALAPAVLASLILIAITALYRAEAAIYLLVFLFAATTISVFLSSKTNEIVSRAAPIALLCTFIAFFVILNWTPDSWDLYMGSGRIGAWLDRSQRLAERDFWRLLFGQGPGSDAYFGTYTWRDKSTHSHNDFLNVALELGLVGIAAFVVMMVGMVFTAPRYLRYFVMIVMLAPFMSGGILFKPTVAPIMALVILHTRMMYETAKAKRGGRPYRPRLIAFTAPHFRAGLAR